MVFLKNRFEVVCPL